MEIEFIYEKENPLLDRTELKIKVIHPSGTPKFGEIRSKIAALKDLDNNRFVLQSVKGVYGSSESLGEVRIYTSNESMKKIETTHSLKKNGFIEAKGEEEDGE
ncbi:MAG: 30S ribosomal protein S24e [Candidatus Methanofastidiosia archaeon]